MLKIPDKLYIEIKAYCDLNDIKDVDLFCNKLIENAFTIEKYGKAPIKAEKVEVKVEEIQVIEKTPVTDPTIKKVKLINKENYTVYDKFD